MVVQANDTARKEDDVAAAAAAEYSKNNTFGDEKEEGGGGGEGMTGTVRPPHNPSSSTSVAFTLCHRPTD